MTAPSPWVVRFAPRIREGGLVLDLAAGSGRHARCLRALGHPVVAVDIDASKMAGLHADEHLELMQADLERGQWPFNERHFDGIVVTNYLHRPLLPRLPGTLAPGGVLIYETFSLGHEAYGRPSNPDFLLRERELLDAFEGSLEVVAHEHVHESVPAPAVRQRICARRRPSEDEKA